MILDDCIIRSNFQIVFHFPRCLCSLASTAFISSYGNLFAKGCVIDWIYGWIMIDDICCRPTALCIKWNLLERKFQILLMDGRFESALHCIFISYFCYDPLRKVYCSTITGFRWERRSVLWDFDATTTILRVTKSPHNSFCVYCLEFSIQVLSICARSNQDGSSHNMFLKNTACRTLVQSEVTKPNAINGS